MLSVGVGVGEGVLGLGVGADEEVLDSGEELFGVLCCAVLIDEQYPAIVAHVDPSGQPFRQFQREISQTQLKIETLGYS